MDFFRHLIADFSLFKILLFLSLLLFINCGVSQEEYDKLKNENKKLKTQLENVNKELKKTKLDLNDEKKYVVALEAKIEELKNTPTERLAKAKKFKMEGDIINAEKEFRALIIKYPDSIETETAKAEIDKIDKNREKEKLELEKEKLELERKKRLGFKSLKENTKVELTQVSIKVNNASIGSKWIFDRYDSRYMYRSARRGYKYILADLSISSESHNPILPPLHVYKTSADKLEYVGTLLYEFYKWEDYGSYLGNDADFSNDFSRTKTIRFSLGYELRESIVNDNALFLFAGDDRCFYRKKERFRRPAVYYEGSKCKIDYDLTIENVDTNRKLIKIFNKNKI